MLVGEIYVTITGLDHYYGMKPFYVGAPLTLRKEPDNAHDAMAIMTLIPMLGKVGYVANSPHTIAAGCISAGDLHGVMPDECVALVRFMTSSKVIARVFTDKKLVVKIQYSVEDQSEGGSDREWGVSSERTDYRKS